MDKKDKADKIQKASLLGRSEALHILLNLDPEEGLDNYIGSYAIAASGDYSSEWDIEKLKELFQVGNEYENSPGCRLAQLADSLYWEIVSKGGNMDTLKSLVSRLLGEIENGKIQEGPWCTVNLLKTWVK